MKAWTIRLIIAGLVAASLIWGWNFLHPSPERAIQKRLANLARAVSVEPNEGQLARLSRAQSIAGFFTQDVEINVDVPGFHTQTLEGRDELMQAAAAARARGALKVQLVDVMVTVAPDGQSAQAHFTGEAKIAGEKTLQAQEIRARLVKLEGEWLIRQVETVRTLR